MSEFLAPTVHDMFPTKVTGMGNLLRGFVIVKQPQVRKPVAHLTLSQGLFCKAINGSEMEAGKVLNQLA